jgi:tetratricopeptide (TPR) repeat protein
MGDRQSDGLRYTAFLSYSHKDAVAAGRLHRRLETYRMPKRLVGTDTARGPVPARLAPIFRDREELPAATDLSETVREALARSGALIVLCSPAAATSLWVAEEIETFRRLHSDRPILAAILEGDPPDCFPQVLRAFGQDGTWHEPLATDLRRHRDGARLGLLKLVAGITGVGLDALVQRDAARKIRRIMAVTAVALAATLGMAALTWVALDARREAERRRADSEGLVEFMQTDLRERLRGVGRLDIMREVNRRALAHFDLQGARGDVSPGTGIRRARTLQAIGEDEVTRGNHGEALPRFREAHRITAALLAEAPEDPERLFAHAQSEYWLGQVDDLGGNPGRAFAAYQRYHRLAEHMNRLAPNNPRYLGELAYAESNLGIANLGGLNRPGPARGHFQRSLGLFLRLARLQPAIRKWTAEAADAHAWIADTWFAERRYRESRAERVEEQRMKLALLRADPGNRAYLYATVIPVRSLAMIDRELGDYRRALGLLGEGRSTMATLLHLDPENLVWRHQAVRIEIDASRVEGALGNEAGKVRALRRAHALISAVDGPAVENSDEHRRLKSWIEEQLGIAAGG